ncbi:hypothetical protein [Paenibacillus taichungensis]
MPPSIIDKQLLLKWYLEDGLTDAQIAANLNIDRTAVVHSRKSLNLPSRNKIIFEHKFEHVLNTIKERFAVERVGSNDLIVHNKSVKTFISNYTENGHSKFRLTEKPDSGLVENKNFRLLDNGWYSPVWKNKCDVVMFVQYMHSDHMNFWMFSAQELDDLALQNLSLKADENLKYSSYMNRWSIFCV